MFGDRTYFELAQSGQLPPIRYRIAGGLLQVLSVFALVVLPAPVGLRLISFMVLMACGEILIQTGWPFFRRPTGLSL